VQEYNVLEEFSVGANIALALELQGRKATDEVLSDILRQVDLEGFGNRRPNELSGGQLQRVAIARALVKDPKIIMADEPTGALDSATGKQILDTLKKLSAEKLVLVVSHDREFAERYADRIVELCDGKVISDQEYEAASSEEESGITYEERQIKIATGYRLTEEDREQINAYLAALEEGKEVTLVSSAKGARRARPTREILEQKVQGALKLIASRLPMKVAFRMGSGALKHKKIRLAFTIFLSCIAFGLFGLADTFGAYDHISTCVQSILDSAVSYASFERAELQEGEGLEENYIPSAAGSKKRNWRRSGSKAALPFRGSIALAEPNWISVSFTTTKPSSPNRNFIFIPLASKAFVRSKKRLWKKWI
jgi:energy-coupling factor transporter ATP-binding protein EcfA2